MNQRSDRVSDHRAVHAAMAEYNRLGREVFLDRYGFGRAKEYLLVHDGTTYDSKAIVGVAHGYQYPDDGPLLPSQFSGGVGDAAKALTDLGFTVIRADESESPDRGWDLAPGDQIKRTTLHDRYGGSRQDGISPSAQTPNVLIFTDPSSGEQHGYYDTWGPDGVFTYTGRGQTGSQTFTSGNKAIRDHEDDGRALRVFEGTGGNVTYVGEFALAEDRPYEWGEAPETGGGPVREVIKFRLVPVTQPATPTRRESVGTHYRPEDETIEPVLGTPGDNPDAVGRGLRAHRRLQNRLAEAVKEAGLLPLSPQVGDPNFDLAWWEDDVLTVVEIKSLTKSNETPQLRSGLGQILDYAHLLRSRGHTVRPVLLVERPPISPHWTDLCRDHDVQLASDHDLSFWRQAPAEAGHRLTSTT